MLRAAALAVFAVLAITAPAQAQLTAPSVIRFADRQSPPITQDAGTIHGSECAIGTSGDGWDGGSYLAVSCQALAISFSQPQAMVELFVRVPTSASVTVRACPASSCPIPPETISGSSEWDSVVLADPTGAATIDAVLLDGVGPFDVDDVAFSTVRQPGTAISGVTSFAFGTPVKYTLSSSGVAPVSFHCSLDGAPDTECSSPHTLTGIAPGAHMLTVFSVDAYGATDKASPARVGFTVADPPVTAPPVADADRDGRPDPSDNCPAVANSDQADGDADGVGNACEQLPAGNVPPIAGVNTIVRQLSGEVFVKLPTASARLGFRGMVSMFQESGFISLKGVASVPIGSTVDTRKGEIGMESAANGFAGGDRRARRQTARIRAGLFVIKQARAKRSASPRVRRASIAVDIDLLSPPRAEAICNRGPAKGIVRTMSMVVKGNYRALGGASTATARDATFNTTDRCDGTLTEVGAGRVSLNVKGKREPIVVRGGRAYLVKAKLFQARKGRRPAKGSS